MKELILTLYTTVSGGLLISKGLDPITSIYMVALSAGLIGFTFYNLAEVAKNAQTECDDSVKAESFK
ncbi:MAG TPA: hypothetical protein DCO67_03525 [Staphylococcus sp.]|nr:hypothetical protein [Staphylococcus sp.]